MKRAAATILPLVLLALATPGRAADPADPPTHYAVKPGDNLYKLGAAYLQRPNDYRAVQRSNSIQNPRRIRPGSTLSIDAALLKARPIEAHLTAFSGDVRVESASGSTPAKVGMTVVEGQRLVTGPNAFATFELSDGSRLTVPSNSGLRIVHLRDVLLTGQPDRVFQLEQGRSDISATPNHDPNARFEVITPASVSAVRGTEFRASETGAGRWATEVLEGVVAVSPPSAAGGEVLTAKGFGVSASTAGVGPPTPLLPPPDLAHGGRTQEDVEVAFEIVPVPGAASYRLQLARDAGFVDLLAETVTPTPRATFHELADGTFFARATAIDAGGLEGLPSTYGFERDLNVVEPGHPPAVERTGRRRRYVFRWSAVGEGVRTYRFQLYADTGLTHAVADLPGLTEPQVALTDLPAGLYHWRTSAVRWKAGRFTEKLGPVQDVRIGE